MSADQHLDRGSESSGSSPVTRARPFRISEVDLDSECREVRVEGELDLAVADQLRERLDAAALEEVDVFVCLEQCDFIDSTGIAAIVLAHKLIASRGRRLFVLSPSGQVSRILAVTGLDEAGLVCPSIEAATRSSRTARGDVSRSPLLG